MCLYSFMMKFLWFVFDRCSIQGRVIFSDFFSVGFVIAFNIDFMCFLRDSSSSRDVSLIISLKKEMIFGITESDSL